MNASPTMSNVSIPAEIAQIALVELRRYHEAYSRHLDSGNFDDIDVYMAYSADIFSLASAISEIEGALA